MDVLWQVSQIWFRKNSQICKFSHAKLCEILQTLAGFASTVYQKLQYKVSCTVSKIQSRKFCKSYLSKFCKALQGFSVQLFQCFAGTKVINFRTVLQWTAKHCLLMLENWNMGVDPSQDITFKKKKFNMHTSWGLQLQKSNLNAREYKLESLDTEQWLQICSQEICRERNTAPRARAFS